MIKLNGQSHDPIVKAGPDQQRELFNRFSQAASGFSIEDVNGAAANVLVNSLRQAHPTRQSAEASFDALFGRLKSLLVEHYDGSGRRRSVFPHHQVVHMAHFVDEDRKR